MLQLNLVFELKKCNLCGSSSHHELFVGDRHNLGLRTVMCTKCSLIFTNPQPDEASLQEFYRNHYRKLYEAALVPDKEYIESGEFEFRANIVLSHLGVYIEELIRTNGPINILDIGCSEGTTLRLMGSVFPDVIRRFGVEPSINFANYAATSTGAEVFCGTLDQYVATGHSGVSFDVVILNHVLEHFSDPMTQLRRIHNLLKPNGLLFVEVPDILGEWQGSAMIHIAHLYNFSEQTLISALGQSGLEPIKVSKLGNHLHPWAMAVVARKSEPRMAKFPTKSKIKSDFDAVRNRFHLGHPPDLSVGIFSRLKSKVMRFFNH